MLAAISNAPFSYTSPRYEIFFFAKTLLKPFRDSWIETRLPIVYDVWKDCKNQPLINVIAVSLKGEMFLKLVDSEGQVKDAEFISKILIESREMVGANNIVQVIMDIVKNCRVASALVEERYEHTF